MSQNKLTSSQLGKADLREAKALWELVSVVFCDSMVLTRPSNTLSFRAGDSSPSGGSDFEEFCCLRWYLANCFGKPWSDMRSSRTDRHSSGVGLGYTGYGSFMMLLMALGMLDLAGDWIAGDDGTPSSACFLFPRLCIFARSSFTQCVCNLLIKKSPLKFISCFTLLHKFSKCKS